MAQVTPTRLERTNQINRERIARRGHKLLKDKSDEMFRNLVALQHRNDDLRREVLDEVTEAMDSFIDARCHMTPVEIANAITAIRHDAQIVPSEKNIMGLRVPNLEVNSVENDGEWSFVTTYQSFDDAVEKLEKVMPKLVRLASLEKTVAMLENEITKLRRRINALEYAVIPQIQKNISYITLKLAENERGNLVRLMKVKDLQKPPKNPPKKGG